MPIPFFMTPRIAAALAVDAGDGADAAIAAEALTRGNADTSLDGRLDTAEGTISSHTSTLSTHTGQISTATSTNSTQDGRLTALEAGTAGTPTNMVLAETVIGSFLGVPLYRKIVAVTAPNATLTMTAHGISGMARVVHTYGLVFRTSPSLLNLPVPYAHSDNNSHILLSVDATNINLSTNIDFSTFAGHVVIEYTKS